MKRALLFLLLPVFSLAGVDDDMRAAGELYFSQKPLEAFEAYKQISRENNTREAYLNAAFIALEQNKTHDAVDIMSAALKTYPADPEVRDFAGEAYLADGQFLNAEKIYSALSDEKNKETFFFTNLARAQTGMEEYDMAEANFRRAAVGAQSAYADYMLGTFCDTRADYPAAQTAYQNALKYDHQSIEARLRYAEVLLKLENFNEAWKQLRMIYSAHKDAYVKKLLDKAAPQRTKTETQILQPKEVKDHTFVRQIISITDDYPIIKVALGARANGAPAIRSRVDFSPSNDFRIYNTSNELIANGSAKEQWSALLENGKAYLVDPKGKKTQFSASIIIKQNSLEETGHTTIIKNLTSGAGMTWVSSGDKEYRGQIEIRHNASLNTLIPINHVNIEEYLFGVIASEMPVTFPLEALRAQSVLSRTYTLKHMGKHKKYGYDVCDTQHCQVYGGVAAETEKSNAAIEATLGEVLKYKGKYIDAVFSANAGGITQSSQNAGWSKLAYLTPQSDYKNFDFAALQPYHFKALLQHKQEAYSAYQNKILSPGAYRWTRVISADTIKQNIKRDIGDITGVAVEARARSGYVGKIRVLGTKGSAVFDKENSIKRALAPGMLRSTYFYIQPVYEKKKLKEFIIFGGGWGHGVGFCQTGAGGRAEDGQDYKTILKHYFPLTDLVNIQK